MSGITKIAGLVMALFVLSVPMVYADNGGDEGKPGQHEGDWHHGGHEHMLAKILGLTETQEKQLKDLRQKQMDAMKSTFEQIKTNREAFDQEIVKSTPDMNKITDLQNQFKTIQGQMIDDHLNSILAIKKIMTPEQYAGFAALKKEKELKKHMEHGKFGSRGGWDKDWDGHKHWGMKDDEGHPSDSD